MQNNIEQLDDKQLCTLIDNRWKSADSIWRIVKKTYETNTKYYDCELSGENIPDYLRKVSVKVNKVKANRIFINTEAVINSVIANPPKIEVIPGRDSETSVELARLQNKYWSKKYSDLNVKETIRQGLRNLYFSRLIVLKPYWDKKTNDVNVTCVNPLNIRVSPNAKNELESDFVIEEISESVVKLIEKYPNKEKEILDATGYTAETVLINNPMCKYKECWIGKMLVCKFKNIILSKTKNPYWDWDGVLMTRDEEVAMNELDTMDSKKKIMLENIRGDQELRKGVYQQEYSQDESINKELNAYYFNHFDIPRKPYIFTTILNNENTPIGRTDFIQQAIPLQEAIDRRKMQIDENAKIVNGIIKVDASVMSKQDAQKLRFDTSGIIWGKNVATGVQREVGQPLPQFVFEDMNDSRNEIDNIMAATSAFRGEREGAETKAGRLALIEQSFLRLNELVQVIDYVHYELFNWFYHLAKIRYTETHYAKTMGDDNAVKIINLTQDDFEDGTEVKVIAGKSLPEDKKFRFERAQKDVAGGILSPLDYMREAGYDNANELAKNAEMYKVNPLKAVGVADEEIAQAMPNNPQSSKPNMPMEEMNLEDQYSIAKDINTQL